MKPHLLLMCPDWTLPVMNGGDMRTINLALGLAESFDITAIIPRQADIIQEVLRRNPSYSKVRFVSAHNHPASVGHTPTDKAWRRRLRSYQAVARKKWRDVNWGWTFAPAYAWYPIIEHECKERKPDVVFIENTRLAPTTRFVSQRWPGVLRCVDAPNVESHLIRQIFYQKHGEARRDYFVRAIEAFERRLPQWTDMLWACSQADLDRYAKLGVRGLDTRVISNGVNTADFPFREVAPALSVPRVFFCGSLGYPPNKEGILWFLQTIWPRVRAEVPHVRLAIVGSDPPPFILRLIGQDPDIEIHTNVPDVVPYLHQATVSICPLHRGSGTRVKILTSFSAGIPVVSTSLGAEGLQAAHGEHLLMADDPVTFGEAVVRLLQDGLLREKLRRQGRHLVEKVYDWRVITRFAADHLLTQLEQRLAKK